jgi:hypothetical protein
MDDFDDCAGIVRLALTSTAASFEIYSQWRKWTGRKVSHDFDQLSRATRPLYYVSYSMYWTLVEAPSANPNGGVYFFCDQPNQFHEFFYQPRALFEGAIMSVQASLCLILIPDPKDTLTPEEHMDVIVSRHLWNGCMRNIHILKETYMQHGSACFSTVGQNWSVIDYLNQSISLVMAVVAYVHAIGEIFLPHMSEKINPTLEDICENLSQIRNEGIGRWPPGDYGTGPLIHGSSGHDPSAHALTEPNPLRQVSESSGSAFLAATRLPRSMGVFDDCDDAGHMDYSAYPGTLNRYTYGRMRHAAGGSTLSPVSDESPSANPHPSRPHVTDDMFGEDPEKNKRALSP